MWYSGVILYNKKKESSVGRKVFVFSSNLPGVGLEELLLLSAPPPVAAVLLPSFLTGLLLTYRWGYG